MTTTNDKKLYTFRTLNATDIAPMCKIISKIGFDEFSKAFESKSVTKIIKDSKNNKDIADVVGIQVFLEIANIIMSRIPTCEKEIFSLLSSVSGLEVEEIRKFDLVTFTQMIVDFVEKEEFRDFLKVVSKFIK